MSVRSSLVQQNVDLAPFNTLQIHAAAQYFARVTKRDDLQNLLQEPEYVDQSIFVLGGGSNVLFVDDFEGLVIQVAITGKRLVEENADAVWLQVGAGENWHEIVRYCVQKGWGGVENLSLIPGTAGAAPVQNIGAYGVELCEVFEQLMAFSRKTGQKRIFNKQDCAFGYRDSIFKGDLKDQFIVTDLTLKLSKNPDLNTSYGAIADMLARRDIGQPTIADISDIIIEIRNAKLPDPAELANAGSFFKNPVISETQFDELKKDNPDIPGYPTEDGVKVPAGWLIEKTDWKGKKIGRVGTYRQQALVVVNHGGATGKEIAEFAEKIQHSIKETFNLSLEPEVNFVG